MSRVERARPGSKPIQFLLSRAAPSLSSRAPQPIGIATVVAVLTLATTATYTAGGSQSAMPHLYYLAVLAAAFVAGPAGGLTAGIAAGLLCGPWMPLDVAAGTPQQMTNWLTRLAFFVISGMTAGVLFSRVRHQTRELDRFTVQSITAFVRTIDAKSPYTARHSENVAAYAVAIGEEMGYHGEALRRLYWAGLLHDIGKLMVPDTILNKPGQLSPDERRIIERHPLDSVAILDGIQRFEPYLDAIRHHHERVDGRGYPDGIAGEALSLDARILAAADAFEAMTSDRPYRRGMEHGEALRRLQDGAGTHFDPDVVAGLRRALDKGALPLRGTRRWLGLAG